MPYPDRRETRPGVTRRLRLKDHDYRSPSYYFVTICTHDRHPYFGHITNKTMHLTNAGQMVTTCIEDIPDQFPDIAIDSFVVMPNHLHIMIGIAVRLTDKEGETNLSRVVQWFKMTTHRLYAEGVRNEGWLPYHRKVWQEGFHDHIVRNDKELDILRRYIAENVERWDQDQLFGDGM
ncbi:MAG: transposase [Thermomicrobiales bacterium]|nr:transposase [Thermomicrobiales bacterium]MCO5218248.1 transposase [Thermomicrobiales bacterium]MCO5224938.1 transposase [Thermomicrobiales bacterium]MCO5227745.1 transposase [Thermomicrobiales bacterium]